MGKRYRDGSFVNSFFRRAGSYAMNLAMKAAQKKTKQYVKTLVKGKKKKQFSVPRDYFYKGRFSGKSIAKRPADCSVRIDAGSELSVAKTLYIGHASLAPKQMAICVHGAIIKQFFKQMGVSIINFEDAISTRQVVFGYWIKVAGSEEIQNRFFNVAGGVSYLGLITTWITDIQTALAGNTHEFSIRKIYLADSVAGVANDYFREMQTSKVKVKMSATSSLRIQNRTLAAGTVDAESENRNNVENNPLKGFHYTGVGNGFSSRSLIDSATSFTWLTDAATGAFSADPDDATLDVNQRSVVINPPKLSTVMYAKSYNRVVLDPGTIKNSYCSHERELSLDQYFKLMLPYYNNELQRIAIGEVKMLGLQKMLDSRVTEPSVLIGYELVHNSYASVVVKRPDSVRLNLAP